MSDGLTPKQEAFAQKYIETGVASEAYRQCYDTENMLAKTVWEEASRTLADRKVAARVKELQAEHAARHSVTVDSITEELEEARRMALDTEQPSAAVSASLGKAKIHGLVNDKPTVTVVVPLRADDEALLRDYAGSN